MPKGQPQPEPEPEPWPEPEPEPEPERQVGVGVMFDAAIAIETIEHCRNIRALLDAVGKRLRPDATLFVQSLCHQSASYLVDSGDWMGRNFFSGGSILSLNSYYHLTPPSLHLESVQPLQP